MSGRVGDLSKEQEDCLQKVPFTMILIEQNEILVNEPNMSESLLSQVCAV